MKKKYFVLSVVSVLVIVISFGLGYTYAFVDGLVKVNDMAAKTHSHILWMESHILTRTLKSPNVAELIKATEENGDSLHSFIITFKPVIENPETRTRVDEAVTAWEQAKGRLHELRALQSKNTEDSP